MKKIFNFLTNKKLRIPILIALLLGIVNIGYRSFRVKGESMDQTIQEGDIFWVNKTIYAFTDPKQGDIIVFYDYLGAEVLVKRIIGLPGDTIEIVEGGIVVNGHLYEDEFGAEKIRLLLVDSDGNPLRDWATGEKVYEYINEDPITLGEGEYWVIGDNRSLSWYGIIWEDEIIGRVYE